MSRRLFGGVFALTLVVAGCARTVSREELRRLEWQGMAETVNFWWYQGSRAGYHYFHNTRTLSTRTVRIKAEQLRLKREFPLTNDFDKWVRLPMGVWFNDSKVEQDFIGDWPPVPDNSPWFMPTTTRPR